MPIDHCGVFVPTSKAAEANKWYEQALKPLGYAKQHSEMDDKVVGFGVTIHAMDFWVIATEEMPNIKMHIALCAEDRVVVDKFHEAAIAAGGIDNGAPGLRPYAANYYATFVCDPAGNNIEVVCRKPMESSQVLEAVADNYIRLTNTGKREIGPSSS